MSKLAANDEREQMKSLGTLPRLLYLADVPIEPTPGNAALYRLLENYPADRLFLMQGNIQRSNATLRLVGPGYQKLRVAAVPRLLRTRFASRYADWLYRTAPHKAWLARKVVAQFKPQAIFSIAHTYSWLIADQVSKKFGLPLHLAVWDDFVRQAGITPGLSAWAEPRFAEIYRRAASRLCISPNMAELFEKRYGVSGTVLYPPRAADSVEYSGPPARLRSPTKQLTFGFAGSVNYGPYAGMLGTFCRVVCDRGHRLEIFGGLKPEVARSSGILGDHVVVHPMLPIRDVLSRIREQVDVLFAPMAFEPDYEHDMHISFPSKLTDYTAVGLPLLIWGPHYCSAARWVRENPGAAMLVEQNNPAALGEAVDALTKSGNLRVAIGQAALEAGNRMFDHRVVTGLLQSVIAASVGNGVR